MSRQSDRHGVRADEGQHHAQDRRSSRCRYIVQVREGDAMQTLAVELPAEIHLVLLDGAKDMYIEVIGLLEPHSFPAPWSSPTTRSAQSASGTTYNTATTT